MVNRVIRVPHFIVLISTIYMCSLIGCKDNKQSTKPSMLIADANLPRKLHSDVIPGNYRILTRNEKWNNEPKNGRYERILTCTVIHLENGLIEQAIVSEHLENWISQLVTVKSVSDYTTNPSETVRAIQYEADQTLGELRYNLKQASNATMVVNGQETTSNHRSLDIQIVEQKKQ